MRIIYLISLFFIFSCKSQKIKCDTISKKNITYVNFEIKSKNLYPVQMSALFIDYNISNFDKTDAESFVKSFYREGNYTPSLIKGYEKMLRMCYSTSSNSLMNKNKEILSEVEQMINSQNGVSIVLNTGDKVNLKSIDIGGRFFNVDKNNAGIFTNSMEWDILTIDEIKKVLIPFDELRIK